MDNAEIADALKAIQHVLADHEKRLFPVDRRGLPFPTGYIKPNGGSISGHRWDVDGWTVVASDDPDEQDCVFFHTPHSMRGPGIDVTPLTLADARWLATAILAAIERLDPSPGEVVTPIRLTAQRPTEH